MKQITVIKLKLCILWALISVCKAEQNLIINTNHENSENSGESVWTVFETNLKNHSFCTDKDAVLIVGNGGSGKTTLISHLTDPNLPTYRVDERINFGDMEIFEAFGVTEASSEIIVPKFVADTINGIDYYNCPSFSETKNIANNVLMKYSTKQLLECSNRVKFVFVIDHLLGRSFEASRDEFLSVAQQAINLMKNMDKYRNSIALVVTKVQNSYTNNHGQYDFISDQVVIDTTANFLINVKSSLKSSSLYNQHVKEKIIGFIDILLEKKDKDYIKIGMSRVQDHPTPQNLELLQLEKQRLVTIINGKLQYVDKAEDDFSFEMAEEMKNHIFELIDDMQKHLIGDLSHIDTAIKEFYEQKETNISDIFAFDEEIASGLLKLSQIRPNEPKDLLERLTKVMHDLNICIPDEYIDRFTEHIEYVNILRNVSNTVDTFIIPHGLKITTKYLDNAKKWYSFIIQLSDVMDRYSAQSKVNLTDIADLFSQCSIDKGTEININEIGLQTFLDQIGTDIFRTVENMRVNSYMLKALKATVGWANIPIQISCSPDKLMVKGHNIKISDLIHIECLATVSFIEVFAMNKLFVDASINEIGHKAQVSFIAPTWEIIGEQKVYLSGENATAHLQPHAEIGMNGLPGQPGGSAGHFIGIGNAFTNDKQLEIVGIGGNGGDGQHGGDQHTGIGLKLILSHFNSLF